MSSPSPARYVLFFYVGDKIWKETPLTLKNPVSFGTAEKCNVRLGVSTDCGLIEEHAWLEATDGQVYLRALGPVKVNGKDVEQGSRVEYTEGERIQLGHQEKLTLVLEKAVLRTADAPTSPRLAPPSANNAPTKKGAKEKKKPASKKDEEPVDSKEEKMEVEPTPKSTAKQSSEPSAEEISEPAESESTKASPSPKKQYGKKQKKLPAISHEGPYAGGQANSKSSKNSPAKKEKNSPKPKETKAAPKSKVAKEPKSRARSSNDTKPLRVEKKDLAAAQIETKREIIYGGEKFFIPPKRTQAEVDKMTDEDILLEAVMFAPAGKAEHYDTYAKRWYNGRNIVRVGKILDKLAEEGLLVKDKKFYYGPDNEDEKHDEDKTSASDEAEVALLDSNSKKQKVAATNSKKKKRKSDESDEELRGDTKRAKSNTTSASESDEK